jgi:hypothetical protein
LNASAWGEIVSTGGAGATVSVTATDTGLFDTPVAEIWTLLVYVPAPRPVGETSTESVEGAVPDADATDSQDALVVALQLSVPPPLFVT